MNKYSIFQFEPQKQVFQLLTKLLTFFHHSIYITLIFFTYKIYVPQKKQHLCFYLDFERVSF